MGAAVLAEAAEASRWLVLLSPEVNHNDAADSISGSLLFKARLVVVVAVVARWGAGSWILHLPRNEIGFKGRVVRGRGGTTSRKAWILDSVNKAAAKRTSPSAAFLECATAIDEGIIPVCVCVCVCVGRAAEASLVGRRGKSDGQQQYSAVTSFCLRDQPILSRVLY